MFDAKIAELKHMNIKFLRANKKYNERYDTENVKLRARIEKMKSEFKDRIMKVKQKQTLNDNSFNFNSSNFNLIAD